jgi:hypothetical protein
VIFKSGLLKRLLEQYCHGVAYPASIYMTIFVKVVNIFAIFENGEFLHSLGRKPTLGLILNKLFLKDRGRPETEVQRKSHYVLKVLEAAVPGQYADR